MVSSSKKKSNTSNTSNTSKKLFATAIVGVVCSIACVRSAHAEETTAAATPSPPATTPPPLPPASPTIHHAPCVIARIGEDVMIGAKVERADHVKRALLIFNGGGGSGEVEFQRSSDGDLPYVAVIPKTAVRAPMLSYAIEIETLDGTRVPVFASRTSPHSVTVLDAPEDARAAATLEQLDGRRSVVQTGGEFVDFGRSEGDVVIVTPPNVPGGPTQRRVERRSVRDHYFRIEGSYTYRLLGLVSEFGIRAGVVRGSSLVTNEVDPSKYDVGLNYGAPRVRVRLANWFHAEGELLISVTEVGFSTGAGGAILLGDPYGSKVVIGAEGIQVFGARGFTRLDVVANRRLRISPIVEVTNMPHADQAGVRLLGELGVNLGAGFNVDLRGGYQARSFAQGGPTLGGGLAYAF